MSTPTRPTFDLVDHHGRSVDETVLHGAWSVVFFGFTHCRLVCPRTLARIDRALDLLGALADGFRPVYVTVDPTRDTPETMRAFLAEGHPRFTGLTGTPDRIEVAMEAFRVFARRRDDPADADGYAVPHTALTYLLDPSGRYHTHLGDAATAEQLAAVLRDAVSAFPHPFEDQDG